MATARAAAMAKAFSRSPSSQPALRIPRRFMGGGGDHHGPEKVNLWQEPLNPSRWKEEHFVLASLAGWGLLGYGGYKAFGGGGKKEKKGEEVKEAAGAH